MDRLNSFASQAKAKAEGAMHRNDSPSSSAPPRASYTPPSSYAPPPPPNARARATTVAHSSAGSSASPGVFVGSDNKEKEAFFAILDEYFASRPQFRELFSGGGSGAGAAAAPARITPPVRQSAVAPPAPPVRRGLGTATALYDYTGASGEDLSFAEGDSIVVLEHVSDDWWKGEKGGSSGLFPSSYVQMDS